MRMRIAVTLAVAAGAALIGHALAAAPGRVSLMHQARITKVAAERIALAKVPSGTVRSAELEQEHGALVWSFDIAIPASRDVHEILVDAKTGAIVYTELETPKAQAEEAAADKRGNAKH